MSGKAVTVTVCRTCRPEGAPREGEPEGARLARAAAAALAGEDAEVNAIACLSACSRGCAATVAAEGKFAYVIGGLTAEDAGDLAAFARAHAESADGVPPWRARQEKVRKNTVARLPPPGRAHALVEPPPEEA